MKTIWGNTKGLKAGQLHRLESYYRRRVPSEYLVTPELARDIAELSVEIQRQIGLLINRAGKVAYVLVGDAQSILFPKMYEYRAAPGRLRGVRCIHTHLKNEGLSQEDLTDLALLRLDMIAAITLTDDGFPHKIHWAHILPNQDIQQAPYQTREVLQPHQLDVGCLELIHALEREMGQLRARSMLSAGGERAMLISVTSAPRKKALDSLAELTELSRSGGIEVLDSVLQIRKDIDSRTLMGSGKLQELAIRAMQLDVTLIIFDQELNASQIRSITDQIDLKVIDRTQLILDIFAQRARSKEGKLQVELAQLKYMQPRLVTKNTAMSRLTGGIGGRGPGETKLEINRRRVRDKIHHLEKALVLVQKQRQQQRRKREQKGVPIISIIGYTNAGKSTLLNTLTHSHVMAESRLFATLDPSSRRLRFPRDLEVLITDTVGFIRNLPKDLVVAFRATLEELESADLLLHVIDVSNPRHAQQIDVVESILEDLALDQIPQVRALNKMDLLPPDLVAQLARQLDGVPISARDRTTLPPLIDKMAFIIDKESDGDKNPSV
ncbi:MAG: GTP-binding protein HflX [Desulfatitalea sp. BRH_c12]|nr:MAG: GTP-binding protein HflX [Desulfatitalea sp. BRH_c12]